MKKIIITLILIFLLIDLTAIAQRENPLYTRMQTVAPQDIMSVALLQTVLPPNNNLIAEVTHYTLVELNKATIQQLFRDRPKYISFMLTFEKANIEVQLEETEIFSPGFILNSDRGELPFSTASSIHYRGVIKGLSQSIAAISILDGEIMGIVSSQSLGNLTIGKLKNRDTHIIYRESELKKLKASACGTSEGKISNAPQLLDELSKSYAGTGKCIRVYIEISNDIVNNKGGAANATNYIAGIFNQSAAIYAAESVAIQVSEIFTWQTQSPYNDTSSLGRLIQFENTRLSFNGDIAHLVDLGTYGGIAHGFDAFCGATIEKMCYSGIHPNYANFPTYSESVLIFTHEMGHLFGSRHTHACAWNQNYTAIDGCGPAYGGNLDPPKVIPYEGNCGGAPVPSPQTGGTIMSYCHLGVAGINFSNGFGEQPGNFIRSKINKAVCLNACCPVSVAVTLPIDYTTKFIVSDYISGSSPVITNINQFVSFDAGKYVQLQPGFVTNTSAGGYFSAYIDGCGGNNLVDPKTIFNISPAQENNIIQNNKTTLKVYPTPFSGRLTINFYIAADNIKTSIEIFTITGVKVKSLLNENKSTSGNRSIQWNTNNLSSGTYLVVLTTDTGKEIKRVVKL